MFNEVYNPEMIDLKITSRCFKNCAYCYQDSKPEGRDAYGNHIEKIAAILRELGVFEVAIGGGEPLTHYEFVPITKDFKDKGFYVGVSTRIKESLLNYGISYSVFQYVDNVGLSVDRVSPELFDELPFYSRVNCQVHLVYQDNCLKPLADYARGGKILLLHPKEVGRGKGYFSPITPQILYQDLRDLGESVEVSVDSLMLKNFKDVFDSLGVDRILTPNYEGITSKYIDAVDNVVAAHSYGAKKFKFAPENKPWNVDYMLMRDLLTRRLE